MKNAVRAILVAMLAVVGACNGAQAGDWLRVESEHFVVTTDGPESKAQDYLRKLEAFRYIGLLVLGAEAEGARARAKFDIYLLKNQDEIRKVRPEFSDETAGVYFHCVEGSMAYSALQNFREFDGTDPGQVVLFHEYAHHLMYQSARRYYPQWYVEGFAEYMSTAQVQDAKITIGDAFLGRVRTLDQDRWIGFERVLKPDFKGTSDRSNDAWDIESFYAQSWLLTHYMLNDSERTRKFNAYFERVGAGEDPIAAFEPATGIPIVGLKRLLKRHLDSLPVITVPRPAAATTATRKDVLSGDAQEYLLNASVLRTCPSRPQGEAILAQFRRIDATALSATPGLRLARDRAEVLFGDVKAANDDLVAHATADEASFDAHYLMGRVLMKGADQLQGDARTAAIDRASEQFIKAYRLNKSDATNLFYLAQSLDIHGVDGNVLNAARGAHALAPGVPDFAVYEAVVDLDADDRDRAVRALMPLASNPHDPLHSTRMRRAIEAIQAGKDKDEILRAIGRAE